MKTYLSVGIGDMMCLDSLLVDGERESITEIYWACRFGKVLAPLMENNPGYPNLKKQYFIDDEIGKNAMANLDPVAIPFWHFRLDFPRNFQTGLSLFSLSSEDVQAIDVAGTFAEVCDGVKRGVPKENLFFESTFIKYSNKPSYSNYILFHYPTSTRPKQDIAQITDNDWKFVEELSLKTNKKVVVVSDHEIKIPLSNFEVLINPDIQLIVDLISHCDYYAGCDSFCSILASKRLPKENLYVKTHDVNITTNLLNGNCGFMYSYFNPHSPENIAHFYKPYIGEP
jgi:hypothetical protein